MLRKGLFLFCVLISLMLTSHLAQANSVYYGPTTNQDHFWQIVDKFRPNESITREQMAVGILQANQAAFANGNVNALRNGQMLKIPSIDEIQQVNPQLAAKMVQQMNLNSHAEGGEQLSSNPIPRIRTAAAPNLNSLAPFGNDPLTMNQAINTDDSLANASLQRQLRDTQQELHQLEQQVNLQVGKLVQQNLALQSQLANNSQILQWILEQTQKGNISNLHLTSAPILSGQTLQLMGQPLPNAEHSKKIAIGIVAIILLILVSFWFPRLQKKRNSSIPKHRITPFAARPPVITEEEKITEAKVIEVEVPQQSAAAENTQAEYDFLSGQEGMVAKLNLARVYIDMQDFTTAANYLREVMAYGNSEQRVEAEALYEKLRGSTNQEDHA